LAGYFRCGEFDCEGTFARITFDRGTVTWSDFKTATYEQSVAIGPFRTKRKVYEAALRAYWLHSCARNEGDEALRVATSLQPLERAHGLLVHLEV